MKEFLKANKGCVLAIVLISPVVVAFFEYIFYYHTTQPCSIKGENATDITFTTDVKMTLSVRACRRVCIKWR